METFNCGMAAEINANVHRKSGLELFGDALGWTKLVVFDGTFN